MVLTEADRSLSLELASSEGVDVKFGLFATQSLRHGQQYRGQYLYKPFTLKAGESKDLGDERVNTKGQRLGPIAARRMQACEAPWVSESNHCAAGVHLSNKGPTVPPISIHAVFIYP